ncbi:MAG: transglycosylase domain-containing protein [Chloroflexi bacterium]|nr:transglycosylase domain-containing protein [Chloroflexota bacterium]
MARSHSYRYSRARRVISARRAASQVRWQKALTLAVFFFLLSLIGAGSASFAVYRSYASNLIPPEEAIVENSIGTSLAFDRNGKLLYEYLDPLGGLRNPVPLKKISPYLIAATIATEDASFYSNPGVNFKGLARAAWENLTPFGPGFLKGSGGSSITQQLVKNVYISPEERFDRKFERKVRETVIALELKRRYDDDQILEWYLNQIYYGNFAYGVEAAAQRYFNKPAKDLTLAEAAMLAGIPSAPAYYSPIIKGNRKASIERQHDVLDLMWRHRDAIKRFMDITPKVIEKAKKEELTYHTATFQIKAPHFVFYVGDVVANMCKKGLFDPPGDIPCDKVVFQGGLRIYTTLDYGLQQIGEQTVEESVAANENLYGGHNGALVAIRPKTGEILTMVGSRDFFRKDINGQVNVTTRPRSHGSTMKLFTYMTGFENGWVPSSIVQDAPLVLDGNPVNNWNFSYQGNITVRTAISQSVNTPAVRSVLELGEDEVINTAHKLGITDLRRTDCGPTITLGACEVKLLDQTYAFSVIANNGVMKGMPSVENLPDGFRELDPASVLRIEDTARNVLYEYKPEADEVVQPALAYMFTDIVSKDGINWSRLTIDRPAGTKTGTSEEFRDNVVEGYTPDLTAGVWIGNADGTPMAEGAFSAAGAGPMWRNFMIRAHEYLGLPPREFEVPDDVILAPCAGRTEVFAEGVEVTKVGICIPPVTVVEGENGEEGERATATPIRIPVFPRPTATATPSPEPEPTRTKKPKPHESPEATATPIAIPTATATPLPDVNGPPGLQGRD